MKAPSGRDRLLELDEVERRLKPFGRRYLGVRAIPLDALAGTEGRVGSFTRDFRPLLPSSRARMRSIQEGFPEGLFPPIVAVKLGGTYFVIDGHHRAALARRGGAQWIDADVTELIARVPLPAGADMLEVVLRELERIFLEDSGLAEARPGRRIAMSRPALYLELLENLQVHGYHLMRDRGRVLEKPEIAANWYEAIYLPTLAAIDRLNLDRLYRDAPPGDLFLILHRHRRDAFPATGCPHLAQTIVSVIDDAGRRRRMRWPGARRPSAARGSGWRPAALA
jgi:ParB/Sulfiredoxin domain